MFLSVYRFHNHRNLQLCFINNSDSEEEEEGANKKVLPALPTAASFRTKIRNTFYSKCNKMIQNLSFRRFM